ncbi:MAG: ABC transporter ATP-binding protein, partial [Chloroflexi bacterium]|nr:ABC transporter ATP-binding protein [Chloroflexota bacterium]
RGEPVEPRTVPLLEVRDLRVDYATPRGPLHAVDSLSFDLSAGQSLGLVGESGCGKTTLALAILRVLPENSRISGTIRFDGQDILSLDEEPMRRLRGKRIGFIPQGALNAFSPVHTIGSHIAEVLEVHNGLVPRESWSRAEEALVLAGLTPDAARRYPHELSGGMRQRAVVALALACKPSLLIADEPATALDTIVQRRLLDQLQGLQRDLGMAMLYISHDLAAVATVASRLAIMYAGQIAEEGPTRHLLTAPKHPYTSALIACTPRLAGPRAMPVPIPGDPPDLATPPTGCRFHPRCPRASERCAVETPSLAAADGRVVACWHPLGPPGEVR